MSGSTANVAISALEVNANTGLLVAATYGRRISRRRYQLLRPLVEQHRARLGSDRFSPGR